MIHLGEVSWMLVRKFGWGKRGREKCSKRQESTSNFKPVQGGACLESINTNVLLSHSRPSPLTQNLPDTSGFPKSRGFSRAPEKQREQDPPS